MADISLHIEPETLRLSAKNAITGVVYFDFGSYQFPEVGWNDFVVVVLNWWLSALQDIAENRTTEGHLRFMDGPLEVMITKIYENLCVVECRDGSAADILFSGRYSCDGLLRAVLEACETVEAACEVKQWSTVEIRDLRARIRLARD